MAVPTADRDEGDRDLRATGRNIGRSSFVDGEEGEGAGRRGQGLWEETGATGEENGKN